MAESIEYAILQILPTTVRCPASLGCAAFNDAEAGLENADRVERSATSGTLAYRRFADILLVHDLGLRQSGGPVTLAAISHAKEGAKLQANAATPNKG